MLPMACRPTHGTLLALEGEGDGTVMKPFEVNFILFIFSCITFHILAGSPSDELLSESLVSISL